MQLLLMLLLAATAAAFNLGHTRRLAVGWRADGVLMQFRSMKSSDDAAEQQLARAAAEGLTPAEYEEATRKAAKSYLQSVGPHVDMNELTSSPQTASFLPQLWGVESIPGISETASGNPARVLATLYEIGGPLTGVLSTSVAKQLPLIPHVGIRVYGFEYFYSDHIEARTVPVMKEMLGERPQVTIDLGLATVGEEEIEAIIRDLEPEWEAKDYHVFDKNCVHFSNVLAGKITANGIPSALIQGPLDVSERMLDSLPEWRRALGRRVMNEVTRLVVVSWGKASKSKKEAVADDLSVSRGE